MFDPETVRAALEEARRLNTNLETLHGDLAKVEAMHSDARVLASRLKDVSDRFKGLGALVRQISILNQIMLQTRKVAGTAGMIEKILSGVLDLARRGS
jgi:hypothetical protein